ncbi:hypothetical protein Hypma_000546 [Hypsizygus marmoreus]|uniref:Meiotically up-regulated gene 152 protein n=1 Tax=Hypsizygus marmoreus TaxID=39966 RepID=A0A369J7Y1_HYPMA|nr:hypothetical protein Hypma_000546 [Hypsizygus marmoreus]
MATGLLEATPKRVSTENSVQVPTASTFSFKAPFPASSSTTPFAPLKQRRVSLALPSSPRVVQAWNFRDDTGLDSHVPETEASRAMPEKRGKMRKIATGADSEPFQEKKQRKKWTEEETQMLVTGCNIHGVGNWKTILSDPTLKFDNRSPVDLKDRFRTYFPDAYKEHYPNARTHLSSKVRSTLPDGSSLFEKTRSKKRRPFTEEEDRALKAGYEKHGTIWATIVKDPIFREQGRRSTDLRDRFRNAFPELYQAAGYKPRNASKKRMLADGAQLPLRAATDDQLAMSTTGPVRSRRRAHTNQGLLRGGTKSVPQSTACSEDEDSSAGEEEGDSVFKTPHTPVLVDNVSTSARSKKFQPFAADPFPSTDDDEMEMVTFDQLSDPLTIPDFTHSSHTRYDMDSQSQTWSSGINTPTHSTHAWSTAAGSPTSSHLSADYLMNPSLSPSFHRRTDLGGNMGMIGKSAWGTQDWFSANPRLDPGSSGTTSASSSYPTGDDGPASPFSFHNLSHGVLDRYDLLPTLLPHDFSSEVGVGDSHSTFSDEMFPPSGFRGFTHHSNYAGDLIFGARTHQPQQTGYGSGFGFGTAGLGLSGMSQATGIHPMLALPEIDEIGLTGITLNDHVEIGGARDNAMDDDTGIGVMDQQQHKDEPREPSSDPFSLDDLVDLSSHDAELHATPPGTPQLSRQRSPTRRSSESMFPQYHGMHGRSISVPPSEARSPMPSSSSSAHRPAQHHSNSQPVLSPGVMRFFRQEQEQQDAAGISSTTAATQRQQPTSPRPPPSSFPPQLLMPSVSQDGYAWRTMAPGDIDLNLSFLDLHYPYDGGTGQGGLGEDGHDTQQQQDVIRQGQALDLAGSVPSSSSRNVGVFKVPALRRQHVVHSPGRMGGASVSVGASGRKGMMGVGRSHSTHQRGQSAVCPQDLLLRSDNKRKRASWDGGHS